MMKICYVINGLGPGGAEQSLAELLPFYRDAGIQITIVCLRHRDIGVESEVRALGCDVRVLPAGGWWTKARALRRILAAQPVDLVHTTIFDADLVGRMAAAAAGIPALTSLVNTAYEDVQRRNPRVRPLRLRAAQAIDAVFGHVLTSHFHAISHAAKASAVRSLGIRDERITVIERGRARSRLGLPSPERRMDVRRRLGIDAETEVLLNVGRQEYQKGQRYLVEAMETVVRSRPRAILLIAGRPGHASADLEARVKALGLCDRIWFTGHRTDVPDLLAAADVFVFPSLYEGLGGAVIEAMAMGLPVVASSIPAMREVVADGRSGSLVEPESPSAMADAIERMLADRGLRERYGAGGRALFEERYSIEKSAARMIDMYRRLVPATGSQTATCHVV